MKKQEAEVDHQTLVTIKMDLYLKFLIKGLEKLFDHLGVLSIVEGGYFQELVMISSREITRKEPT